MCTSVADLVPIFSDRDPVPILRYIPFFSQQNFMQFLIFFKHYVTRNVKDLKNNLAETVF